MTEPFEGHAEESLRTEESRRRLLRQAHELMRSAQVDDIDTLKAKFKQMTGEELTGIEGILNSTDEEIEDAMRRASHAMKDVTDRYLSLIHI